MSLLARYIEVMKALQVLTPEERTRLQFAADDIMAKEENEREAKIEDAS